MRVIGLLLLGTGVLVLKGGFGEAVASECPDVASLLARGAGQDVRHPFPDMQFGRRPETAVLECDDRQPRSRSAAVISLAHQGSPRLWQSRRADLRLTTGASSGESGWVVIMADLRR
jgi:hypothetical protein